MVMDENAITSMEFINPFSNFSDDANRFMTLDSRPTRNLIILSSLPRAKPTRFYLDKQFARVDGRHRHFLKTDVMVVVVYSG
jgi:hypothetical protein